MASFKIAYETADEQTTTGHRMHVKPLPGETNWQALIRVVEDRGLKLLRARAVEASSDDDAPKFDDASSPIDKLRET